MNDKKQQYHIPLICRGVSLETVTLFFKAQVKHQV